MPENPHQPRQEVVVPERTIPLRRIAGIAAIIVALVAVLYFFAVGGIRSHRTAPSDSSPNNGMAVESATTFLAV
jgi:hypothetical protein